MASSVAATVRSISSCHRMRIRRSSPSVGQMNSPSSSLVRPCRIASACARLPYVTCCSSVGPGSVTCSDSFEAADASGGCVAAAAAACVGPAWRTVRWRGTRRLCHSACMVASSTWSSCVRRYFRRSASVIMPLRMWYRCSSFVGADLVTYSGSSHCRGSVCTTSPERWCVHHGRPRASTCWAFVFVPDIGPLVFRVDQYFTGMVRPGPIDRGALARTKKWTAHRR